MDIVNFWEEQIDIFNTENKCGFCWEFFAPLFQSKINIVQSDNCCVKVFLTDLNYSKNNQYNSQTGFLQNEVCEYNYNLHVVIPNKLGTNNYNEIKGYDTNESNYTKILQPLTNCFGCDSILEYCKNEMQIPKWNLSYIENFQDMNYTGLKINITFKK